MGIHWLMWQRRCLIVTKERGATGIHRFSRPDLLGVTKENHLIEIEIKRSVADFRANFNKPHVRGREIGIAKGWPRQFYFLVPNEIREKVAALVPKWAGLLSCVDGWSLSVAKRAPANRAAEPLTQEQFVRMAHLQCRTILANEEVIFRYRCRFERGESEYLAPEYQI